MGVPAIYTHQLTRLFDHQPAVDRLSLTVSTGTILGMVGPDGAGKTTLLRLLGGRLLPSSGSAHVLGYDVWTQSEAIRSSTLLISDPYAPHNPIRCEEILATIQSSIQGTPLVLLDEPIRNVDAEQALDFCRHLAATVHAAHATLVLTGLYTDVLRSVCDSFAVLFQGMLLATAPAAEIHTRCVTRVEIYGCGFTHDIVTLLRRRAAVSVAIANDRYLCLYLQRDFHDKTNRIANSAPLITLLVESGAEVEEVNRQLITLAELGAIANVTDKTQGLM